MRSLIIYLLLSNRVVVIRKGNLSHIPLLHLPTNVKPYSVQLQRNLWWGNMTLRMSSFLFFLWRCGQTQAMTFSFFRFLDHIKRRNTVGMTSLDEWSARRRYLYMTTHNNHKGHISMSPAGFEPAIPASERPQTYALDRAATGTGLRITLQSTIHNKACLEDAKSRLDYENLNIKVFVEPEKKYILNTKEPCMCSAPEN